MTLYDAHGDYLAGAMLPLATGMGREIPNERRMALPPERMRAARDIMLASHSSAKSRSLSSAYNCMGMVFATRRTWVEPEHLRMILEDDGYQRVTSEGQLELGDVVLYQNEDGDIVHVGIVADVRTNLTDARKEVIVLSQWGRDGEYFHRVDDVHPLLGNPTEYWTDRT